ncbi:Imm1 family immunity protein [Actinophytocola sediminis]
MTTSRDLARVDLAGPDDRYLQATGVFYLRGAVHNVTFDDADAVVTLLELMGSAGDDTMVHSLYLTPQGESAPSANLRFQFNREHQVAGAVLVVLDRQRRLYSWRTLGNAGRDDVLLVHDAWNPGDTALPPEAFITVAELRAAVVEFVTGEVLPPRGVEWAAVADVGWS